MKKDQEFKLYQLKVELCSHCSRFINDLHCDIKQMLKCSHNAIQKWEKCKEKIRMLYITEIEKNNE